ncbi:MAG TPA: glutathione S-transferase [Polyangiaceae bacterium]|nr:glutathione S-transferase [Polyangiaceae bacterium]
MYELYYWPSIPGRGEFVRLALEDAAVPYRDVAREKDGVKAMMQVMRQEKPGPFAPPFLKVDDLLIAQTAAILHFLGPRLGLVDNDEERRALALQMQLTIADIVAETHDNHHPIASGLYYEDQREEAKRRTTSFLKERMPKYLHYFEAQIAGPFLFGENSSYADLSLFQLLSGLDYAYPRAFRRLSIPKLGELRDRVAKRPNIDAYLASERRIPFNEDGIFRHYPELDIEV